MDPSMTDDLTNPELGNVLFEKAMKGRWGEVVDICTENPWSLVAGITRLEDTLLHLAVSGGQEETVRKLTYIISEQPNHEMLLRVKNERGNTALHIAALMGNEAMCKCIASVDSSLIGQRNYEGETPLFTAVLFGKIQAFQSLYDLCPFYERYSYSRNTRGDTILHCAISGDHFDLALLIIELYGEVLVNAVNEDGITPLHLLADKPSAFPSGSRLGVFDRIIYQCMYVDERKVMEPDDHFFQRSMQPIARLPAYERNPNNYPENYRTCNDFYRLFWNFFTFLRHAMGIDQVQTAKENPEIAMGLHVEEHTEENPEITMGLHVEVQTAEENPETSTINPGKQLA
ncbi:ankyrin repeat-containing protein ITN1-like [Juglans microcarpa x Juglans regia]|uniref:ankyrin repeat-containing protein ITN1-like n=1 Tax=Juglans microcarpa x Juglans regia TaxID=2249226 RepID=UPI001B7DB030|nr:ankyrin repeat-containing protein ITN1-like [Juglans microcarpa x Juglans regia]